MEQIVADEILNEVQEQEQKLREAYFRDMTTAVANGIGRALK